MRQILIVPCLLASLSAAAAGRNGIDHGPLPDLDQLIGEAKNPRIAEALDSRPLFFRLEDGSAKEVIFGVTVAGRPFLQETVTVGKSDVVKPSVEFLARDRAQLDRLYDLAARDKAAVEVHVFVDGRREQVMPFSAFVSYNRDIKAAEFRPTVGTSVLSVYGPDLPVAAPVRAAPAPDGPCQDQCDADYFDCQNTYCGGGCIALPCPITTPDAGAQRLPGCSFCTTQYNNCIANCTPPPCTDPKSVTTSTTSELIGVATAYYDCFKTWWDPNSIYGEWYQGLQLTYKITTYRHTEYCNGTVTVEPISVSYAYAYCNHPTYATCFYPFLYPYNVCY